jgi:hypothetical protein
VAQPRSPIGTSVPQSPFGLADYKSLTGHRDVRAIEESFLPVGERRDYRAR